MDFPIFHLDLIGDRMLIAFIATVHTMINHAFAVGLIPVVTLLEYLGYKERISNPERGKQWDDLAWKVMKVGFITTTSLGALTGVGIWLSVSLVNPAAIGSLIRVFYGAWFSEWIVFMLEVIFIMGYFLWWKKSNESHEAKKKHIIAGASLSVFSWLTMAIICAILGFMMNPGNWLSTRSFISGFTNPVYIPQLYFRTPLAMMMGGALVLFLIPFFLTKGNETREKAVSFVSLWLLIWAPVLIVGALLYRASIPGAMMTNFPTAVTTMAFIKWYNWMLAIIIGSVAVAILIALWGFLKPRKTLRVALVIPIIALFVLVGSFERVREFIRKPFIIGEYMYANGLRVEDYTLYKKNGVLPYATYVDTHHVTELNKLEAGENVFMITCSRCHTINGLNSVVTKFRKLTPPGVPLNPESIKTFIAKMDKVRYYMPPFPGNEAELDALVSFIMKMNQSPKSIPGAQSVGVKVSGPPKPRDIPLPLPLPKWLLIGLLICSFLLHILFVNLMLGGSLLTLWAEIKGLKNNVYDSLSHDIADTVTVNKSLAIVLGVAPLLSINVFYTLYFYSANALTGSMWISIVPIVSVAFLLLYYHKYTWDKFKEKKRFHICINGAAAALFLFVPLIFLTNINLMLFPDKWGSVKGFFSAMMMRNVFPRYLHFLCASLAITGLFLFWRMKGKQPPSILRKWYKLALFASLTQLGLGPLNLFTLPWDAVNKEVVLTLLTGLSFAVLAMFLMWKEIKGPDEKLGKYFYLIVTILTITVLLMGTGRHLYRASSLFTYM